MQKTITRPAAKIIQSGLTIYSTSIFVSDLLEPNFYQIEHLTTGDKAKGYQRVLDERRKKKIADYLIQAFEDGDAFIPTSIFLATDKDIAYDETNHTISFDVNEVGPFQVVDGQHRVAGLIEACQRNEELRNFQIGANIAVNLDEISQMCHFLIVNSTQKAVDSAITQQIHARLTEMVDFEEIPTLPKWIQRQVLKGEDRDALYIVNFLNTQLTSPWYGKISMANESRSKTTTIKQNSFVRSVKRYILSLNNPLMRTKEKVKRNKILLNYWTAIYDSYGSDERLKNSPLFKTIGLDLFNQLSHVVFSQLFLIRDFKVQTIKNLLKNAFSRLHSDYSKIGDVEFWIRGGEAGRLNQAAVARYVSEISRVISVNNDEIEDIEL